MTAERTPRLGRSMATLSASDRALVRDLVARTRLGDVEADLTRTNHVENLLDSHLLEIVGAEARRRATDDDEDLSAREHEVALLVGVGSSTAGAAETLGVSIHTVKTQLQAVYRKLGLRNAAQLGGWVALELGRDRWNELRGDVRGER